MNQRIACSNDPKRPVDGLMGRQNRSKRAPEPPRAAPDPLKTAQKPPKTFQRGSKTPPERPKTPPGALLERSWGHLGTIRSPDRQPDRSGSIPVIVLGDFDSQNVFPNDFKSTPKRVKNQDAKRITFLSHLNLSLLGLEAIWALSWGRFWQFSVVGKRNIS